ncbi:hypothetical protein BH10BAC5_BH10BAC5_10830 [soil metagenome]
MAKQKIQQKTQVKASVKNQKAAKTNIPIDVSIPQISNFFIWSVLIVLGAAFSIYYLVYASSINHYFGFPLDDPWIHLTFAKNLAQYHSFSYYKNEISTAGSTSPLYTIMLGIGFLVTNNEMMLSYVLGILFFCVTIYFFYRLSLLEFSKEYLFAIIAGLFLASDKWLNFVSVSGMETTLFIALLIAACFFYKKRQAIPLGIVLGLIMWTRPDGIAFFAAIVIDYLYNLFLSKSDKKIILLEKKELYKIAGIFGVFTALYFIMNLSLSGSLLPNTYNAKLTYYSPEFRSRGDFLKNEVWGYFTSGSYGIMMAGFIISVIALAYNLFRKKADKNLLYILFVLILVFIYWFKLPYAHRFGRYLMPVIPFLILVSVSGFREAAQILANYLKSSRIANGINFVILALILITGFGNYKDNKTEYTEACKWINDRQVVTARWLKDNTSESDIIGTHDVGAIAFYSGRKIVDVAGLVTPELIKKLNDPAYSTEMTEYMKKAGVTYLAFLREWYRVVNQNPIFTTPENAPQETMDIFKFIPDKTHILPKDVNSMLMYVGNMMAERGNINQVMQILNQAVSRDPESSLTYFTISNVLAQTGDLKNMEKNLLKAVEIFPDYKEANLLLANLYRSQNRFPESKKYAEKYLELEPKNEKAKEILKAVSDSLRVSK